VTSDDGREIFADSERAGARAIFENGVPSCIKCERHLTRVIRERLTEREASAGWQRASAGRQDISRNRAVGIYFSDKSEAFMSRPGEHVTDTGHGDGRRFVARSTRRNCGCTDIVNLEIAE